MKIPFFASFIIFIIWFTYELHKTRRSAGQKENAFWEREAQANSSRRKPLDNLNYITIPFETLPMHIMAEDEMVAEYHQLLHTLSASPIVNFTGYTNTDLKLEYGAPNIELLMRYDQSYTLLASTLQKWADKLYKAGYTQEVKAILEFALSTDTDVSGSYRLLASIYSDEGQPERIDDLLHRAENLRSASKNIIVRTLKEFGR